MFPQWTVAAAAAFFPAVRFAAWRRRANRPDGTCPDCGYDLRATPERCPE